MRRQLLIAFLTIVAISPTAARAITVETRVTSKNATAEKFSIKAAPRSDGRILVTITRKLDRPLYLNTNFQVRKAGNLIAEARNTSFALEDSATWYLTVSADHLAESIFEYSERPIAAVDGGGRVPTVGGTNYIIRLVDFPAVVEPASR